LALNVPLFDHPENFHLVDRLNPSFQPVKQWIHCGIRFGDDTSAAPWSGADSTSASPWRQDASDRLGDSMAVTAPFQPLPPTLAPSLPPPSPRAFYSLPRQRGFAPSQPTALSPPRCLPFRSRVYTDRLSAPCLPNRGRLRRLAAPKGDKRGFGARVSGAVASRDLREEEATR